MGKEKRVRRNVRSNPIGLRKLHAPAESSPIPAAKELDQLKCDETSATFGLSREELVGKLRSQIPDERASGAVIAANMASKAATLNAVNSPEVIKAAIPLLLDRSLHVSHSVFRYLGNIGNSDEDGYNKLLKANIMPTLETILKKFVDCNWSKIDEGRKTILEDLLYLLEGLCENSETAVEIFNSQNYFEVIFPMLKVQATQSYPVSTAAAWCLLAVSECDGQATMRLREEFQTIEGIINYKHASMSQVHMKALGIALLCTLKAPSSFFPFYLSVLKEVLETPTQAMLARVCDGSLKAYEVERARELEVENLEKMHKELDFHINEVSELLRAKKVALETLTNLCCEDEDDDEWDDVDSDDESSRNSVDETMETEASSSGTSSADHLRTIEVAKLLSLIEQHTRDLEPQQIAAFSCCDEARGLLDDAEDVRCRAYLCIDNIFQRLRMENFGGVDQIRKLFEVVMKTMTEVCRTCEPLFIATSSALRAILDCVSKTDKSTQKRIVQCVNPGELMTICQSARDFLQPSITMNACRIVTHIALAEESFVLGAAEFLFLVATSTSDLQVCTEAYDCIIDLFSGDDLDGMMHEFELLEKLKGAAPSYKSMYKGFPKSETKMLAVTCSKNLQRFIKYKSGRR